MRYFLIFLISLSCLIQHNSASALDVDIVSRVGWWADETLRYGDSPEWKSIYPAYLQYVAAPKTQVQLDAFKAQDTRVRFIENIFGPAGQVVSLQYSENGHPLVYPIERVKQVSRIIIHHEWVNLDRAETDEEIIRRIYRSHTLSKQWGDIAYNYIIGQRGQIYEWRAGGYYSVGIHALYNNRWTVGVVILGDYSQNHLNRDQIAGLERLIPALAKQYGITLSASVDGVECTTPSCETLRKITTKWLIGHRDVRATDCPWGNVYPLLQRWIAKFDTSYAPVYNPESVNIESIPANRIMNLTLKVESSLPSSPLPSLTQQLTIPNTRYIWAKFRVKLSTPDVDTISLSTPDTKVPTIQLDRKKIFSKIWEKIQVWKVWNNKISIQIWEKYYTGTTVKISHSVVRIDSWDRVPDWDKSWKYNDNLFRDTIRVFAQDGKLIVINDLPIEWYLKGMWEVSNWDLPEKIKTIVISARSYARWYMDPRNRKFNTSLYDGSDDPDIFQKYLGYSYELRSPSVAKMVDATRSQVITYSGQLIKPWYHSSSDGRTLSALEYCQQKNNKNCVDTPYLQSVADPGSEWKMRSGHGVGISGIWATYWARSGWDHKKIIQYYFQWVEIQRK